MEYDVLATVISAPVYVWNTLEVQQWLRFIHLDNLVPMFQQYHIDGKKLMGMGQNQMEIIGIANQITKKKLSKWIKQGFQEFEKYLLAFKQCNKQNIPPKLNRMETVALREPIKQPIQRQIYKIQNKKEEMDIQTDRMVIRSYEGSLAAFYVMKNKVMKIGRSPANTIRSLQISFGNEHAQISQIGNRYYLKDLGTQSGTFIKIIHRRQLQLHSLVELGSFLLKVTNIDRDNRTLIVWVQHMPTNGHCQIMIRLQDRCSFYSFGRRKTNDFHYDDEHLSGSHAKIGFLNNQFFIEDMLSTNGTWLRLSNANEKSTNFELNDGQVFKIGTTITYQCQLEKRQKAVLKEAGEYRSDCVNCGKGQRNILLVPCHHNVVCLDCADKMNQCVCGVQIQEKIKIYL